MADPIGDLATGIWQDLGSPPNVPVTAISGRLTTSGYIGQLDSLLFESHWLDYSYTSGVMIPPLNDNELAIYAEIYKYNYYKTLSTQIVNNIGNPAAFAYSLIEGDSKITMTNQADLVRITKDMAKDTLENIRYLAHEYNKGQSAARDVEFPTIELPSTVINYTFPAGYNNGIGPGY